MRQQARRRKGWWVCVGVAAFSMAHAENLTTVYQQSLKSDPVFQGARATWLAAQEGVAINRGALLPQVNVTGSVSRSRIDNANPGNPNDVDDVFYNNNVTYGLTLTQPIFNYANWALLKNAKATAKQAEAQYSAAAQDLMMRTATAYFNVLEARDVLQFTQAQKKATARQLEQTRQQYRVGLIAITAVYQAQASYDNDVAQELAAANDLADRLEDLRAITGQKYKALAGLDTPPLISPHPADTERWVEVAERQNYSLLAANYGAQAAQENVQAQNAGHFPELDAVGSATYNYDNNTMGTGFSRSKTASAGLSLGLPVYQGGQVVARTQQARDLYQGALSNLEATRRAVDNQTRQAYLGVITGISKIAADQQAIVSSQSSLEATQAGYEVGTQTMLDVLLAQSKLYDALKQHAVDQYDYILQVLTLKQQAGTLSADDLQEVNTWLKRDVEVDIPIPVVPATKPRAATAPAPGKAPAAAPNLKHAQATSAYTIQLLATADRAAAERLAREAIFGGKAQVEQIQRQKKTTYLVRYGHYKTFAQARAALRGLHLSAALRAGKPWITRW